MIRSLFLFSAFLLVYLLLLVIGNFEMDFSGFFLGNFLSNKVWIFIILGIGIFWSGKNIIDQTEKFSKIFLICFLCLFLGISIQEIIGFFFNNSFLGADIKNTAIIFTLALGSLVLYQNRGKYNTEIQSINISFKQETRINQILYLIIFIISSIIIIFIAKNQAVHIDDMYTYSTVKGYNLYGENKLNILGLYYEYPLIYLYFTTKLYNLGVFFGFSEIFSLRFFNVILTILFLIINFFVLNLYNITGKTKLIIFGLISINIPIISTLLIARLYPINIIFIIISIFLFFKFIKVDELKYKIYYFIGICFLGILSWFFHPVNTIHILTLSILSFSYLIYIFISKYKFKGLKYILFIGIISIFCVGLLLFLRPNIITYIENIAFGNEKIPIINYFQSLLTFFEGINFLFIGIITLSFIIILFRKIFNNKSFFLYNIIFVLLSYIIHKELLADRSDNIRYMIDVSYIFLIIFLYGLFYLVKILGKIPYYIILTLFISLYISHNINFLIKTNNKSFSYFQMRNFGLQEKFYLDNNKFNGETLITDLWLPGIEKSNKTYFISSTKNSELRSINNLDKGYYENKEQYNKDHVLKVFPDEKYVYDEKQDFMEINGFLSVMNQSHLEKIINKDEIVHILVGFTFFDNWHIDKEKLELRNYILNNCDEEKLITTQNELYINTPIFWKYNDQLMFYCKIKKFGNL